MKIKLNTRNYFSILIILTITFGISACNLTETGYVKDTLEVQDAITPLIVDSKLSLRHLNPNLRDTPIDFKPFCSDQPDLQHKYIKPCPSENNGFKKIGTQNLKIKITAFQKESNSVDCYIVLRIRGYPPIPVTWHEPGDTCSAGQIK